jgi:outer membrane protein assembly factor BamB
LSSIFTCRDCSNIYVTKPFLLNYTININGTNGTYPRMEEYCATGLVAIDPATGSPIGEKSAVFPPADLKNNNHGNINIVGSFQTYAGICTDSVSPAMCGSWHVVGGNSYPGYPDQPFSIPVQISEDGKFAYGQVCSINIRGSFNCNFPVVSTQTGDQQGYVQQPSTYGDDSAPPYVNALGLSPDATRLFATQLNGTNPQTQLPFTGPNLYSFNRNATAPASKWTHEAAGTFGYSQIAISADSKSLYAGNVDSNVYAFNAQTGQVLWVFGTGAPVMTTPLISNDGGRLFVASTDGAIYALDTDSGSVIWTYFTGYSLSSSPTLSPNGDALYIGSDNGFMVALTANGTVTG